MMKLEESLLKYEELLKKEFVIILGKKGNLSKIEIVFNKCNYYHMAGIHKIKDKIFDTASNKAYFYDKLKDNYKIKSDIVKSNHYVEIESRLDALSLFEHFFSTDFNYSYKFIKYNSNSYTNIKFIFLLKIEYNNDNFYYFLNKDSSNKYIITSCFVENKRKYEIGLEIYKVIQQYTNIIR